MLKKILITIVVVVALGAGALYGGRAWLISLLPDKSYFDALKQTQPADLPYISDNIPESRGRILAVVTSTDTMGEGKQTGYEHTELARAYWVFTANGFDVDIASPKGGTPPVVYDGEDMGAYDYAFINDKQAQEKVSQTLPLAKVDASLYEAVYFVGGKGTMFDFPYNEDIKRITKTLYQNNKVISAVCHGPAALVNVRLDNGELLLANKQVSGFTNEEELFLIPDAKARFGFLLEDKIKEEGGLFRPGTAYLENVTQDGRLITGQNPWSVWLLADKVVETLGYPPKPRTKTPEEHSVKLLVTYHEQGLEAAKNLVQEQPHAYQQFFLILHGLVALMQYDISKGLDILSLAVEIKSLLEG